MTGILNALIAGVSGAVKDAYFNLVSLLLPGNGTNGAQNNTFLDSGTANSGSGFTITRNGNTTQGTFSPFSQTGWASYSAGGSGNYWAVGGGMPSGQGTAFTLECWIYVTDLSTYRTITRGDSAGQLDLTIDNTGLVNIANTNTANICQSQAAAVQANRWHHIMVTRTTGNVYRIYVDGVGGTASSAYNTSMTANPRIGYNGFTQSYNFVGYISNFRVTNTLVQSNNFTPPTTPLTAISGTQLLVFQSNRFVDNSGNTNSITPSGSVAITPFSPFAPTQSYSAAAVGGSGYFDGTGDYLTVADNAALEIGNENFTIECWVYLTAGSSNQYLISKGTGSDFVPYQVVIDSTNKPSFYSSTNGSSFAASMVSSTTMSLNSWNHIAVCRVGSAVTMYLNGNSVATGTVSGALYDNSLAVGIGGSSSGGQLTTGYISNVRIVKGTAVYTSAFTPPTAPLTAVSGTSLLLNFTNAGVVDATAKNVLETVGNAQISTTQSKWGGGSISFDGTGDYLKFPASQFWSFSSGDWVIEGWLYPSNVSGGKIILEDTSSGIGGCSIQMSNAAILIYYGSTGVINAGTLSANTWVHFALVKSGSTSTLYIGGISVGTTTTAPGAGGAGLWVGCRSDGTTAPYTGYMDDIRITKGTTRGYTGSTITVPTAPFPLQ